MVGMTATIGSFLAATQFMSPALKKIVHPVFATATGTLSLLALYSAGSGQLLSTTLTSYYGSGVGLGAGDILASMLTPAVVGFGVQLYHRRQLLLSNSLVVLLTTFLSAVFGVGSSAVLTKYLGIRSPAVAMATLTRSVTTPLGLIGAAAVKADATVAALMISLTGILGATVGPQLLNKLGVKSPLAIGLSVGSSAHGVGSASLADEPLQFASSVLAMTLTGLWTVALLIYPPSRKLSLKLANF
jgi:putative effector of murein hydrolase